jgi:hypothetical protein
MLIAFVSAPAMSYCGSFDTAQSDSEVLHTSAMVKQVVEVAMHYTFGQIDIMSEAASLDIRGSQSRKHTINKECRPVTGSQSSTIKHQSYFEDDSRRATAVPRELVYSGKFESICVKVIFLELLLDKTREIILQHGISHQSKVVHCSYTAICLGCIRFGILLSTVLALVIHENHPLLY